MAGKKERKERNPFGNVNVVEALTGGAHPLRSAKPSDTEILLEEEKKRRERQAKLRKMKPWQRKKYERDRQRNRWAMRLPEPVVNSIQAIADKYSSSPASALAWLMEIALREIDESALTPNLEVSRDLHNLYQVALPENMQGEKVLVAYDIDAGLQQRIRNLGLSYKCSLWSLVSWIVYTGVKLHETGEEPVMIPSRSMKYAFSLRPKKKRAGGGSGEIPDPLSRLQEFLNDK